MPAWPIPVSYTHLDVYKRQVQKIVVDSVIINSASDPYHAITYATITQTRATTSAKKKIVTRCDLEDVPRSLNSPNGLFIRRFQITDSKIYNGF